MQRFVARVLITGLALSQTASAAPTWGMKDVQALATAKSWSELLAGAENVPPSARSSEWAGLVSEAAGKRLQEIAAEPSGESQARGIVDAVTQSEEKYPFLLKDSAYLGTKGSALESVAAFCASAQIYGCGSAIEALSRGLPTMPKGVALKTALLMESEQRMPSETFRFWAQAALEDRASCEYGPLQNGALNALSGEAGSETARTGVKVAELCYGQMEAGLLDRLKSLKKGEAFAVHACPILKAHGKNTMAMRDKCP